MKVYIASSWKTPPPRCPLCHAELELAIKQKVLIGFRCLSCRKSYPSGIGTADAKDEEGR